MPAAANPGCPAKAAAELICCVAADLWRAAVQLFSAVMAAAAADVEIDPESADGLDVWRC